MTPPVPTMPNVLMGPSLTSFIASNYLFLRPSLVTIPGGTFTMSAGTDHGIHQATLSTFQMGQTLETTGGYERYLGSLGAKNHAILGSNPLTKRLEVIALGPSDEAVRSAIKSAAAGAGDSLVAGGLGILTNVVTDFLASLKVVHIGRNIRFSKIRSLGRPASNINWYEAFVYAFLHGGTLPTEWQWEYAALNVHKRKGLVLEIGNFAEWMQNWYGEYPSGHVTDPTGWSYGEQKIVRGGLSRRHDRATFRDNALPETKGNDLGFRVVVPVDGPAGQ